jgi:hypothetical protein
MRPASSTRTTWPSRAKRSCHLPRSACWARTEAYDHCNFTVLDGGEAEKVARFRELLLAMSYADATVRRCWISKG